jgi:NhaP-type Na+/H+ or K+/H+ antiporter
MHETLWFLIVGAVLVFMGVAATTLRRLPVSAAMFYLAIGYALGPPGMDLLRLDMVADAHLLRIITEVALLVSLFAIGLRLRLGVFEKLWTVPLRLGFLAMLATIPLLTLFGDHDLLRFALSGEGGLNDGIALPFAVLGLTICAAPAAHIADALTFTLLSGIVWGVVGAIAIGGLLGGFTTHAVTWLRTHHAQALGLEGFFALGLIGLSFGAAQLAHTYGFLAVFAAGVAMRRVEHRASGGVSAQKAIGKVDSEDVEATAANPSKAHAYMTESVMGFTIELERIAEVAVMAMVGNVLATLQVPLLTWQTVALTVALFVLVRPVAVELSLVGSNATPTQRRLMSWFGIRGIGSFYYLAYALEHGAAADVTPLVPLALAVVAASVVIHGVSATPLMTWYHRLRSSEN